VVGVYLYIMKGMGSERRQNEAVLACAARRGDREALRELLVRNWGWLKGPVRAKTFSSAWRFAAGLAAGLLIGFLIHHVLAGGLQGGNAETESKVIAKDTADQIEAEKTAPPPLRGDVIRNVDYFGFTDEDGGQWLVEGLRENMVRPAVYYGDL
jgi:hypothetical protein